MNFKCVFLTVAPVHTAASVKNWLAARGVQMVDHAPYSPDLAPADFFLFPKMKEELAGRHLTQDGFKMAWEGSPGPLPPTTSPPRLGGGLSAARSVWRSAATMSKNLKK